jgi:deoxyribonuclease IV
MKSITGKKTQRRFRLGVHVSIAGRLSQAVERADELGCSAMQIFSRSPRGWAVPDMDPDEVKRFCDLRKQADIWPLAVHASYLINLAASDADLSKRSSLALIDELKRAESLGADYLVVHVGSAKGSPLDLGIRRVIRSLKRVLRSGSWSTQLLLENTAGEQGDIGSRLEELGEILDGLNGHGSVGICLDTCHLFAAGYDIRNKTGVDHVVRKIPETIGVKRIKLIHANDSKKGLGCRVDRHQHIGMGGIGLKGFKAFVNHPLFRNLPYILETPKDSIEADLRNLEMIRQLEA